MCETGRRFSRKGAKGAKEDGLTSKSFASLRRCGIYCRAI